jgi:cytochrome oxidase Cu insertion factor (SCO1/SenC/PrrC family)
VLEKESNQWKETMWYNKRKINGRFCMSKFYEFKMKDNKGNDFDFANLKGKVVLIVNSATS